MSEVIGSKIGREEDGKEETGKQLFLSIPELLGTILAGEEVQVELVGPQQSQVKALDYESYKPGGAWGPPGQKGDSLSGT
jgi:hypothetical protein